MKNPVKEAQSDEELLDRVIHDGAFDLEEQYSCISAREEGDAMFKKGHDVVGFRVARNRK